MFFTVLAEMGNRGFEKAKQLHGKMFYHDFWKKTQFTVSDNILPGSKEFGNAMIIIALKGYAYSKDPNFQELTDSVYQRISNVVDSENQIRKLREVLNNIKLLNREILNRKLN